MVASINKFFRPALLNLIRPKGDYLVLYYTILLILNIL